VISIVIPVFNEGENIIQLTDKLKSSLKDLNQSCEVIFINDCSTDDTELVLSQVASKHDSFIKVINLHRNCGQTAALMAGINHSRGDIIIPMDGDLQNDPADIPRLIAKLDEGYDVVSGWRKDRKDAALRRNFPSRVANKLISWVSGVKLHDYGCSLKAYRRDVIKNVKLYGEMHRFVPIYAKWQGARVAEIPVQHHPRIHGTSKYGLNRIFKVLLDLIVIVFLDKYFDKPMHIFGGFGLLSGVAGFFVGLICIYLKLFYGTSFIQTPLPMLSVLLVFIGVLSVLMGLMAEVIIRIYYESQQRNAYIIKSVINHTEDEKCVV